MPRPALAALLLAAMPAMAQTPPFDREAAKADCGAAYPGDFFMIAGCVDLRERGHADHLERLQTADPALLPALRRCEADYAPDWFMVNGCGALQQQAWERLNR